MNAHKKLSWLWAGLVVLFLGPSLVAQRAAGQEAAAPPAKKEGQEPEKKETEAPPVKPEKEAVPAAKPETPPAEKKASNVAELAADLKSGAGEKRTNALRQIGSEGVKDKALLPPLLDVIADRSEANAEARPLAVRALVNLEDSNLTPVEKESLITALMDGVRDKDHDVQMAAIQGIGPMDTAAEPALFAVAGGDDAPTRIAAFQRLAMILANQPPVPKKGPPPAPPELLKALDDENADVRNVAALCFWAGGFQDKRALPAMLKMFEDKTEMNVPGRTNAIHALGFLRSGPLAAQEQQQVLDAIQAAMKDESPGVRYYAVWGIQRGDKALLPALDVAVTDVAPKVRAIAQQKLFQIRGFEASTQGTQAQVASGLSDADPRVRAQAVRAFWLGGHKDPAAITPLLAILEDKDDGNRIARLDAIRILANLRAGALSDEDKGRVATAIIEALKDPYFAVRYQAARAITAADSAALPALQFLEKSDDNPLVQPAVKEAIQRLETK